MQIFSIAGWSESGKTTLITRLIQAFCARGRRVLAVKKTAHGFDLQPQGKDSRRFLEAGAAEAFIVADDALVHLLPLASGSDAWGRLQEHFLPEDIVLLEGVYVPGIPVIEVWKPELHAKPKFPVSELAALVSDAPLSALPVPCFATGNLEGIIRFIEEHHGSASHVESQ